jgi:ABC-type transport system substrate-binding protein
MLRFEQVDEVREIGEGEASFVDNENQFLEKGESMKRAWLLIMLVVALAVFPMSTSFAKDNVLRIGWIEAPQAGMNPFLSRNKGDYIFLSFMYKPLVIPLMDGTLTPWLAKSWEYDAKTMTWSFIWMKGQNGVMESH